METKPNAISAKAKPVGSGAKARAASLIGAALAMAPEAPTIQEAAARRDEARVLSHICESSAKDTALALIEAARVGWPSGVSLLLGVGQASAKRKGRRGNTALMCAVAARSVECVAALIPRSNLAAANDNGHTALMIAAGMGISCSSSAQTALEIVELLSKAGAAERQDDQGRNALMIALHRGNEQAALALIPLTPPDQKTKGGWTALMTAIHAGLPRCAELMLETCDLGARDAYGRDARSLAKGIGDLDLVKAIEARLRSMGEKTALEAGVPSGPPTAPRGGSTGHSTRL